MSAAGAANGWIGVDLDGTLAHYGEWLGPTHIGEPVKGMVRRVRAWLAEGREVRIFTARICPIDRCVRATDIIDFNPTTSRERDALAALRAIQAWSGSHFRTILPVTNVKDYGMIELWDDRCVQVGLNTGEPVVGAEPRGEVL